MDIEIFSEVSCKLSRAAPSASLHLGCSRFGPMWLQLFEYSSSRFALVKIQFFEVSQNNYVFAKFIEIENWSDSAYQSKPRRSLDLVVHYRCNVWRIQRLLGLEFRSYSIYLCRLESSLVFDRPRAIYFAQTSPKSLAYVPYSLRIIAWTRPV